MVVVLAAQAVNVQRYAGGLGEGLEGVGDHLGAEVADALAAEAELDDGVGPVGDVDDGAGEGLVEGAVGVTEAGDADGGAEGGVERGAEGYADVLGGVVVVDWEVCQYCMLSESAGHEGGGEEGGGARTMEVTLADDGEAPPRVLREGVEHVVQEADARVDADGLRLARLRGVVVAGLEEARVRVRGEVAAVEVQRHLDLGLVGVARDGGPAGRVRRHVGRFV